MPFVKVGTLDSLHPDNVMQAEVNGATYAICNFGGELRAFQGECPHAGGPLGEGTIENGRLVCPWHAWEYDCPTGANDFDETLKLESFPVKVENGEIYIDPAGASAGAA
jgi:nitrite reductase/ring-hydroxylating ferredoxin subunit